MKLLRSDMKVLKDGTLSSLSHNFIANSLPLPLFVLNNEQEIKFANKAAASYLGIESVDLVGKNIYMIFDMAFPVWGYLR